MFDLSKRVTGVCQHQLSFLCYLCQCSYVIESLLSVCISEFSDYFYSMYKHRLAQWLLLHQHSNGQWSRDHVSCLLTLLNENHGSQCSVWCQIWSITDIVTCAVYNPINSLHCALAAVQYIVISPVCVFVGVFVCGSVTTITQNCVHWSSPNWVCR